jgi:geranylgeranyl diphosphate synthase, type II
MRRWPKKRPKERRRLRNKLKLIAIDKNLNKYLPKGSETVKKAMKYSVMSGGKRIRPIIAIEASRACGGNIKDVMGIACAIEFIHTYSLIHDDLPAMDDDDFRRGKPTCHKVFGEANAILAGDALLTLAFNTIARHSKPKAGLNIIKELSDAIGADGMVGGQALDLEFQGRKKTKDNLNRINLLKTARFFEVSAKAGALAAGASKEKVRALQRFGLYLGISFQLVDDHLDGETKGREGAGLLIKKAKDELKVFGKRADNLKSMADSLLKRTK